MEAFHETLLSCENALREGAALLSDTENRGRILVDARDLVNTSLRGALHLCLDRGRREYVREFALLCEDLWSPGFCGSLIQEIWYRVVRERPKDLGTLVQQGYMFLRPNPFQIAFLVVSLFTYDPREFWERLAVFQRHMDHLKTPLATLADVASDLYELISQYAREGDLITTLIVRDFLQGRLV
jgi:hypothetical protein